MIATLAGVLAGIGVGQALVAAGLVGLFVRRLRLPSSLARADHRRVHVATHRWLGLQRPRCASKDVGGASAPTATGVGEGGGGGVTLLKPLHGAEPLLEDALETAFRQDYPEYQLVFGVGRADDAAVAVVRRLQERYPRVDSALVVDPAVHGPNGKVGNLINMFRSARHDVIVIADSDVHARPDYLARLTDALAQPGVGLVTTLYAGLRASGSLAGRLGAMAITYGFLPSAVLARRLGRQDCLGATMCLRRGDLERIGGFRALVEHLADDNVLGRRIQGLGLTVALAGTVPLTTVPESAVGDLFAHELRWARTIRALEPAGFAASVLQYPLFWGLVAVALSGAASWSLWLFFAAWVLRGAAAMWVASALATLWMEDTRRDSASYDKAALAFRCPVWLLPLRDILSVAVMLASYGGRRVMWRGQSMHADSPPPVQTAPTPIEGN